MNKLWIWGIIPVVMLLAGCDLIKFSLIDELELLDLSINCEGANSCSLLQVSTISATLGSEEGYNLTIDSIDSVSLRFFGEEQQIPLSETEEKDLIQKLKSGETAAFNVPFTFSYVEGMEFDREYDVDMSILFTAYDEQKELKKSAKFTLRSPDVEIFLEKPLSPNNNYNFLRYYNKDGITYHNVSLIVYAKVGPEVHEKFLGQNFIHRESDREDFGSMFVAEGIELGPHEGGYITEALLFLPGKHEGNDYEFLVKLIYHLEDGQSLELASDRKTLYLDP